MNLKEFTIKLLEFRKGIISKSFLNHDARMKVELYTLLDFLDKFLKKSTLNEINKKVKALLVKLLTIYNAWDKQDIDNMIQLCEVGESQELNYEDFIVSDVHSIRFIHKTAIELVEKIMKNGFYYDGTLNSTARMCPRNLVDAKQRFFKKHRSSDAAIILEFPLSTWAEVKQKLRDAEDYETCPSTDSRFSKEISIHHPEVGISFSMAIKPEFIVGYIDLRDNSIHLNPYRNR